MSGHSKWATIKRAKAKTDAVKGANYARMSREIIVAARMGGGDPTANFRLRQALDRAKFEGLPNDNIQRAIKKGLGDDTADQLDEITYEGYGPGGVAVMVEAMTDNRNRTAADIRSAFTKAGGNMGDAGCVGWMFQRKGQVSVPQGEEDSLLLAAADAGAEDVLKDEEGGWLVTSPPERLEAVRLAIAEAGFPVSSAEVLLSPLNTVEVQDRDAAKKLIKLMNVLDELQDVQNVTANFDIPEALMAELALA